MYMVRWKRTALATLRNRDIGYTAHMVAAFLVAQILAMIFLAMLVLGLRDMIRDRSATTALANYLPFILTLVVLIAWAIWLMVRVAPTLGP